MRIGVYGLGRFGAFWAERLAERHEVAGYSRSPGRKTPRGVKRVKEKEILSCDAVFLCVAISAMEEVVARIAPGLRDGLTVFDTCSVKIYPVKLMEELLPGHTNIIGTHPMFGPDSASGGIEGLPMILHPVRLGSADLERWRFFFERLGLSVQLMEPELHDRQAAFTQGLTHYLGRVLAELQLEPSRIASLGYRKLLEIIEQTCNDSWQLFYDLQQYNPYTRDMRDRLAASLSSVKERLDRHQRT